MNRRKSIEVAVGNCIVGGDNPILIQSMCNTDTRDIKGTIEQIKKLENAGCHIVRVAVPNMESAQAIKEIKKEINIPLVADIHFDYKLAIKAMENGIDKIRINPGNIGSKDKIKAVVDMAKSKNIPIRIGVNGGSLEKYIVEKYNGVTPMGLVESALEHVKILEELEFYNIIISIKASDVNFNLEAYDIISKIVDYPLHIGVTEAGTLYSGTIKSAVGIGSLLSRGIGDTFRVSLTADPVLEIGVGKEILKSLGIIKDGIEIISCPTCGRTQIDLIGIATKVEELCKNINKDIKVAVMGCVVNGPGEAKEADIGIAGGNGVGIIFKKGKQIRQVKENELIEALMEEVSKY